MTDASRRFLHLDTITMRWGDMDALGHLNNTYYFRYMEQARISWLDSIGAPLDSGSIGPVIAHISCDFKQQLVYPADVEVLSYCTRLGNSSMKMTHEFKLKGDANTIYATGEVVLVWVDYVNGGSVPLPQHVRRVVTDAPGTE